MKEVLAKNCRKASRVIAGLLAVFVLSSCVPGSRDQQPTTAAFVDAALHQQTAELINLSALRMRRSADGSSLKNMDVKWRGHKLSLRVQAGSCHRPEQGAYRRGHPCS